MSQLKSKRKLLISKGNGKLGKMMIFSIPAGDSCPGKSQVCFDACYARKNYFALKAAKSAYKQNWQTADTNEFVSLMVNEIKRRPEKLFRIHSAGDFYSPEYVKKWIQIAEACPDVKFYAYTRSWRVKPILKQLLQFRRLTNVRLWFSIDKETGLPKRKYKRIRLAYMQVGTDDVPKSSCDLVFRDYSLRKIEAKKVNGVFVCPPENAVNHDMTCTQCGYCWRFTPQNERDSNIRVSLQVVGS